MNNKEYPLWTNFFRKKSSWADGVVDLWSKTPLFSGIKKKEILALSENMHPRKYTAGETIFCTGDLGAGAALIVKGRIDIRAGDVSLIELGPGDFFGELALVMDERRTADAISLEESELVFLLRSELHAWIDRAPRLAAQFLANLSSAMGERLHHANEMLKHRENC